MYSVLYVDDEPALLDVAKLFLERTSELQVSVCTSAEEALASPSIASYDAIISDYQMPAMDGITFLKAVRERFGDVPFILFTGRGREEVVIEAINNGADFYIQKGGDPKAQFAELLHKIRQAVRRKQAERSLQDSERRLADIIDFLPDATFAIDRSGSVIAWNRAIEDMTGVPSGAMRGQDGFAYAVPFYGVRRPILIDLISEPDEKIAAFYPNVSRSGTTLSTEIDLASPSGQRVFLLAMACPLYNQAGEVTGAIESIRDVTNYKTIQRDLKRSEERYRSIVNDQTEMIVRFTPDGTITFTNEAFRSFFAPDLPGDALEGEQIRAIMPAASLPDDDAIVASLTPARPVYELEIQTAGPDGVPLWHFWSVRALFDEEKNPAEYQVVGRDITGQKQAEEELLLLKNSIDQAYDEVFKLDFDGNILYVNDAASRTTGYSHDELCSMTIFDLDADVTPAIWDRCVADLRERKTQYLDARHRRRDGTIVDVEISASYIRKGDREYSFTFVRDITARKQVEDALRESEGRFRGMAERSSDMILVIDKSMTPSYVSPAVRPILGYEPEELVGQTAEFAATEIFSGCSREFGNLIRANMQGKSVDNLEVKLKKKDGGHAWVSVHSVPIIHDGVFSGLQVAVRDNTARKLAEMALAESEEKFRSFVENANDIIYEMTPVGILTYVSPKVTEQLGYDPREILGVSFSSFIHPDDLEVCRRFAQETITTGVKKSGLEYRIRHRNGSWQWHSTTTSPIRDADGRIVTLLGICRDITERKTTERALRLANKKLGLLVGITRHDIRNQLLALKGYLAVSKDALGDPDLLASYIASEERIADTIAHQIDFSRDYNELGAGAPTWQNVHRIVTGVAARLPVGAVRVDAGDPKLEVLADPLLEKVFYNLFDNALKYGKGMITAIRVSARTAGENLVLSVEDDGGGIGAGEKTRIFEKGVGKNTGLGLYLSREILSITGIAITENGEPGKGARFEMTVPAGMFRFACR